MVRTVILGKLKNKGNDDDDHHFDDDRGFFPMLEKPSVLTNNQSKTAGALPYPRQGRRGVDPGDIFLAWGTEIACGLLTPNVDPKGLCNQMNFTKQLAQFSEKH